MASTNVKCTIRGTCIATLTGMLILTKHEEEEMSKDIVLAVLERATEDITFYGQLAEDYAKALQNFDLTQEERTAIATGDVRWIESHIGRKLDERIMSKVLIPLLSREKW